LTDLALFSHGNPRRRWCPHTPFPKQQAFLDLSCTEALYGGAAGSAKSDAMLMAALQYVDVPGYSAILFRRTITDLQLPDAIMSRAQEWLAGSDAKWNEQKKQFTFPSSAHLTFAYLEGPRDHFRYQGAAFQFAGFDEISQFEERQVKYIASRLRRPKDSSNPLSRVPLRLRGATNPGDIGHDWLVARYNIPEEPGADIIWSADAKGRPIAFVPARLEDNPHIDREAYEEMLEKLDPITYAQLRKGHWIRDGSSLVYAYDPNKNLIEALPDLPKGESWTRVLGGDFGVTDPTALAALAFTRHDPCVYIEESDEWAGLAPSDAGDIIEAWQTRLSVEQSVGDFGGLGKGFEAEFAKRYVSMSAADKTDKLGNIKLLNGDLTGGRLKIVKSKNPKLIDTISKLQWKNATHQAEHPRMANHTTDAMLYAWRKCRHWAWEERDVPTANTPEARAAEWESRIAANIAKAAREESESDGFSGDGVW